MCCLNSTLFSQTSQFVTAGEIVFEKTINMHAVLKRGIDTKNADRVAAFEQFKKTQPQFLVLKSKLFFDSRQTSYLPEQSTLFSGLSYFLFDPMFGQINKVYANVQGDSSIVQKEALGEIFTIKDKKPTIKWKITDDTREIAGFTCRRANGIVNDSVYVVAFYTNKIPLSAGPESFHGLPGMILGLAIPNLNVTWFANQVTQKSNLPNVFRIKDQGKKLNRNEFRELLSSDLKTVKSYYNWLLFSYLL